MRRKILLWTIVAVIVAGGIVSCMVPYEVEPTPVEFTTIAKDYQSAVMESDSVVISDEDTWEDIWDSLVANLLQPPLPPEIDWVKYMLLAHFMGERPTSGYEVEFIEVLEGDEISVTVREISPAPDYILLQVTTAPYDVIQIPKTDKEVQFTVEKRDRPWEPDYWPWPMFHGDPQRTGFSNGGIDTTAAKWTFTVQNAAANGVPSSAVVGPDGTIYVGSMGADPQLFAIKPDGSEKWRFDTGDYGKVSTSPAISPDGTKVYVFTHDSSSIRDNYFAVDTATGVQVWSGMLPNNDLVMFSNPVVVDEGGTPIIYVCGSRFDIPGHIGEYALYRINGNTGIIDWYIYLPVIKIPTIYGPLPGSPSPAVANDWTIYCSGGNKLYAINPNGSTKWSCAVSTAASECAIGLAINEQGVQERIYVGTTDHRMVAVQENTLQNGCNIPWSYIFSLDELPTVPAIADLNADGNVEVVFAATSLLSGHVYAVTDLGSSYDQNFWPAPASLLHHTVSSVAVGWLPVSPPKQCKVFICDTYGYIYTLDGYGGSQLAVYFTGGPPDALLSSAAVGPCTSGLLGAPGWVFATGNNAPTGSNPTGDGLLYAFGP